MMRVLMLCAALALAACVPHSGSPGENGMPAPEFLASPGQRLSVRLESGGTSSVIAGQPYVSALGEKCVQVSAHPSIGAACLRNGEWTGLPDIFVSRPNEEPRS
jgi:hypothetical protein